MLLNMKYTYMLIKLYYVPSFDALLNIKIIVIIDWIKHYTNLCILYMNMI